VIVIKWKPINEIKGHKWDAIIGRREELSTELEVFFF